MKEWNHMPAILLSVIGSLVWVSLVWFGLQSWRERQGRAVRVSLIAAGTVLALTGGIWLLPSLGQWMVLGAIGLAMLTGMLLFLLPVGMGAGQNGRPKRQVDERDIMFARVRLQPDTPEYTSYYALRPQNKATDDHIRSLPGLLSSDAQKAHPLHFAAAQASFSIPAALRGQVDGAVAEEAMEVSACSITAYIKGLAKYYGAHAAGITTLQPYHVYSHIGRGSGVYGAPVELDHRYAIAFTVEMDHTMVGTAPAAPEVMEAARQYAAAAQIAVQLACFIRSLGYPARAHIDGNYRVIAPLVARDAGLGEFGRMGLLMTPDLGPRVRLGVVTTQLPLVVDAAVNDPSVIDFCRICKKCAVNCPSRAIPFDDRQKIDGELRWKIDDVRCFRYWNVIGSDCGKCMAVCPYAHSDHILHNGMRWAIRRSGFARRVALGMDDLFYGRKPAARPTPAWMRAGDCEED